MMKDERNIIYNENCLITMKRMKEEGIKVNYILTSPPDFEEVGMNPKKDEDRYFEFIRDCLESMTSICKVITIFISDRMNDCRIVTKYAEIAIMFKKLGYNEKSYKPWIKLIDTTCNKVVKPQRRTGIVHTATFVKKRYGYKQYDADAFRPNFWNDPHGENYDKMSEVYTIRHLENFTKEGDLVYDPFVGYGTVPILCKKMKRDFLASELNVNRIEKAYTMLKKIKS